MTRDEFNRRIAGSGNPLKALARAKVQQRRADRQAARALGVSAERARNVRLGEAITAAFERMSAKVRGNE